ncbi:MAG: Transcriptional regulator of ribosomal biogenesis proteins [Peltula sp. TS41687]|nr:MAG: Transcriptional regulator of ribosomal biogenesis proteins [Peltula sp. TS41687]
MSRNRDSTATPPLAHASPIISDPGRTSTVENTPISTPVGFGSNLRRQDREKDLFLPWHHKPCEPGDAYSPLHPDEPLLESSGLDDYDYPLFISSTKDGGGGGGSGGAYDPSMTGLASPIELARANNSRTSSPAQNKTSNLTSALQSAPPSDHDANAVMSLGELSLNGKSQGLDAGRRESVSGGISGSTSMAIGGARPISTGGPRRERPRRESLAGSMVQRMSWGGVSVGSWIRDDIIMTGTSPFTTQTPSYHSSSYLPRLEASFMRDFNCCGEVISNFHRLLQHFEERHPSQLNPLLAQQSQTGQDRLRTLDSTIQAALTTGTTVQPQIQMGQRPVNGQAQPIQMTAMPQYRDQPPSRNGNFGRSILESVQDLDVVEDMEMDDVGGVAVQERTMMPSNPQQSHQLHLIQQPSIYPRQRNPMRPHVPPLDLTGTHMVNALHQTPTQLHHGLRNSQPTTPLAQSGRQLQNNPMVSSVNTPTLTTQPIQQRQDPYSLGTMLPFGPAPVDTNPYNGIGSEVPTPVTARFPPPHNLHGFGFGNGYDMLDLCIDEPAKRLFSPNGNSIGQQQFDQLQFGMGQLEDDRDQPTRRRRGGQPRTAAGTTDNSNGTFITDEQKPFKCPVIGCEKAYKNQNGLKYHKTHGHVNQKLQENPDGTFSIVNPETSAPYPGTLGMEKEKPYGCEVCGKRYKNLNGLKYHKSHSPPCDPERKLTTTGGVANPAAAAAPPPTATTTTTTGTVAAGPSIGIPPPPSSTITLGAPIEEHAMSITQETVF